MNDLTTRRKRAEIEIYLASMPVVNT